MVLAVSKVDRAASSKLLPQLTSAAEWDFDAYVPQFGHRRGHRGADRRAGVELPAGPALFPPDMDTDQTEEFLIAEIIREKFLNRLREELPHSLHVRLNDMEDEDELVRIEADVLVERKSQKGIVIGKGGLMLEEAGSEARQELETLLGTRFICNYR